MDDRLRTPLIRLRSGQASSELQTAETIDSDRLRTISPLDEILSIITLSGPSALPKKILFRGEGIEGIASYAAGWMAGHGMDVIVLDGANRFNPYLVSSFARRALVAPEAMLKKIRIARAFTCYQMATLMEERLVVLVEAMDASSLQKERVILLGPITPFLDEEVPDREVRPLLERALKKVEELVMGGVPFFLFQSSLSLRSQRTSFMMKRLSDFSDLVWRISFEDEGPKVILEKRWELKTSLKIVNGKIES